MRKYVTLHMFGTIVFISLLSIMCMPGLLLATQATDKGSEVVQELSPEKVGEDANQLLERINSSTQKVMAYNSAIESASAEDRQVLQIQLTLIQDRIMSDVHQLADTLLALEKDGKQSELREQVESAISGVTPRFEVLINQLRGKIDKVRARRTKAPAAERPLIESEVSKLSARLNQLYKTNYSHIEKMEMLGLDTREAKTALVDRLSQRGEALSGRILLATQRIDDLKMRIKETPDDADAAILMIAAQKSLKTNTTGMGVILDLADKLDIDTKTYRAQLVEVTQDLSSGLTDTGVAVSLVGSYYERGVEWLIENGPTVLLKLLLFCGIVLVFYFVKRGVRAGLEKALRKSNLNLSELARRMIVSTVANLVFLFGLLIALSQLGISLGPLLAGLGVAGFIVGFALQDSLSNFASGVMILIYRPYDVGDLIDVSGAYGKVHKMNLVSTTITTLDNQNIVVPNNKIWGDVIKNVTAQDIRRVDMVFGISYTDDIDKSESILYDILKSHDKVLSDPEPVVKLHTLGESSVDFVTRPWTKVEDYWDVYWDITKAVKQRFDAEGISIPFPQRDVHVYKTDQ